MGSIENFVFSGYFFRKIITCEESIRFLSFFDMLCKIVKNMSAHPPGALEGLFGPICSLAPDGSTHRTP